MNPKDFPTTSTTFEAPTANTSALNIESSSNGTAQLCNWSAPKRVKVDIFIDRIEVLYTQYPLLTYGTPYFENENKSRVFKITYSCVDGKWNKSDPIYGEIIPATQESYQFD